MRIFATILLGCLLGNAWGAERGRSEWVRAARSHASFPFHAIGVYWNDPAVNEVRARASADGRTWTDWVTAHAELTEPGRIGSGLIYFGAGNRYFEVDGVENPEVLAIDPGGSAVTAAKVAPAPADPSAPPVIPREQWGCTPQTCPAQDPPLYTTVTHFIVHHTDGVNATTDWAAVVRSIWVLHVHGNGWNDIGYNYLIDPNGLLYEGRAGGDGVLGAHFSGVNSGTMGVALMGTYIDVCPPQPMLDTLETMLVWQAKKWGLDPSGERLHASSGLVLNTISGHRDASLSPKASGSTECPGNTAYSFLPMLRERVLARTSSCALEIGERNRCVPASGGPLGITVVPAHCAAPVNVPAGIDWLSAQLEVKVNTGPRRSTRLNVAGLDLTVTQAGSSEPPLPCTASRGVVNSADFDSRPVVAGSQISIFGANFSATAKVAVNGKAVSTEYAGLSQINLLLPTSVSIGTNHLTVAANGVTGPEVNFWVTEAMPGIYVVANADDNTLNAPETPVAPGRPLTLYLTGGGAIDNTSLHKTTYSWSATVGGEPAGPLFLGLAPFFVGVYQANVLVPADLAPGTYPLAITIDGVTSRDASISVAAR